MLALESFAPKDGASSRPFELIRVLFVVLFFGSLISVLCVEQVAH